MYTVQWDVARPAFEAAPAGRRYPLADGVTHVVIRKAAGLWVRGAVAAWHAAHGDPAHLLIGELPLVGGRFIELARPAADAAEEVLAAPSCRFAIPVPSREVRAFIERERDRRMARPVHAREREDAPSHVLRALWDELVAAARALALPEAPRLAQDLRPLRGLLPRLRGTSGRIRGLLPSGAGGVPYDPAVYEAVYRSVLVRRHTDTLPLARVLAAGGSSAYDLGVPARELLPSADDAERAIRAVEARSPGVDRLAAEAGRWYLAP